MKRFIEKLEHLLSNNNKIDHTSTAVSTEEMYLVHVYGYKEHVFSVKIATSPKDVICFFGYNEEVILPLNDENFGRIADTINRAVNFGYRIIQLYNEKIAGIYELIAENRLTPDAVLNIYKIEIESKNKLPCRLICSDFSGDNIFNVDA